MTGTGAEIGILQGSFGCDGCGWTVQPQPAKHSSRGCRVHHGPAGQIDLNGAVEFAINAQDGLAPAAQSIRRKRMVGQLLIRTAHEPESALHGRCSMSKEAFQLSGSAASVYEAQKVPAMFGPLADATLRVVPLFEDDQIIGLACGTGIVARKVRQKLGSGARIVGVDLNEGMIEIARSLTDQNARSCDRHVSNVTELPFEKTRFASGAARTLHASHWRHSRSERSTC